PERASRPDTVALWQKVRTVSDPVWTSAFTAPAPLDKAHGARVVVTYEDGSTCEDELLVANAHPRGATPWGLDEYRQKFLSLSEGRVANAEARRFLDLIQALPTEEAGTPVDLAIEAGISDQPRGEPGLFT
ncbi:MAG: MmgE/PrpD family protein, partial [Geminicoccaceae bacterium]